MRWWTEYRTRIDRSHLLRRAADRAWRAIGNRAWILRSQRFYAARIPRRHIHRDWILAPLRDLVYPNQEFLILGRIERSGRSRVVAVRLARGDEQATIGRTVVVDPLNRAVQI